MGCVLKKHMYETVQKKKEKIKSLFSANYSTTLIIVFEFYPSYDKDEI